MKRTRAIQLGGGAGLVAVALAVGVYQALAQEGEESGPEATAPPPVADALSADEVKQLFAGTTEEGVRLKGTIEKGTWKAYYAVDGTVTKVEDGNKVPGVWFVDPLGRHCFRWERKNKTKCDVIVPEGDEYLRIRGGQLRGRMKIVQGNRL